MWEWNDQSASDLRLFKKKQKEDDPTELSYMVMHRAEEGRCVIDNKDFKQRQREQRRERHRIRENPKSPLRMTGGEQVDVLRSDPTRV